MKRWMKWSFLSLGLLSLLGALATAVIFPSLWSLHGGLLLFALSSLALGAYSWRQQVVIYLKSDHWRGLRSSALSVLLLLGILGLLNYLSYKNPWQRDLTKYKVHSLSPETHQVLASLERPLTLQAFLRKDERLQLAPLLELYRVAKPQLEISIIDPELNPDKVERYGIKGSGMIRLAYGERDLQVKVSQERELTSAIVQVTRAKDPWIYFVQDHGGPRLGEVDQEGLSVMAQELGKKFYQVAPLQLMSGAPIPQQADVVVILSPETSFSEQEIQRLESFMERGGDLLVGLDPQFGEQRFENLRGLLARRGVLWQKDFVIDRASFVSGSQGWVPLSEKFGEHVITEHFKLPVFFPVVASLEKDESLAQRYELTPLVFSSEFPHSWSEKDMALAAQGTVEFDPVVDPKGPRTLAMASEARERQSPNARLVVFGNGHFVDNVYQAQGGNFRFFENTISWLVRDRVILGARELSPSQAPLILSAPHINMAFYFTVLCCPLILLSWGSIVYWRRVRT